VDKQLSGLSVQLHPVEAVKRQLSWMERRLPWTVGMSITVEAVERQLSWTVCTSTPVDLVAVDR
jgi:hypothetical protein